MRSIKILVITAGMSIVAATMASAAEAPAAFDNLTNGHTTQAEFDVNRGVFEEVETIEDGLGPMFNQTSCVACHGNPVTGGISQTGELRAGHFNGTNFIDHPGGSLINDQSINANFQEQVLDGNEVTTFRTSLNVLGDGFVESIANATIVAIRAAQPSNFRGTIINVPLLEAPGQTRTARFGWKNQHASLISFAADAYLNEMGITSPLQPTENTSNGRSTASIDTVPDPEDDGADIVIFAEFMRSTKAPPRGPINAAVNRGSALFDQISCNVCHTRTITTSAPGTVVNGGTFTVTPALGNKTIHPFSDFLLHNIGTGDGIVQNGGQATRNFVRTPPLWGVRTRSRLMHDGESLTFTDAILRHNGGGGSTVSSNGFRNLSNSQKADLIAFLKSL